MKLDTLRACASGPPQLHYGLVVLLGWISDSLGREKTIAALGSLQTLSLGLFAIQAAPEWVQLSVVIYGFAG